MSGMRLGLMAAFTLLVAASHVPAGAASFPCRGTYLGPAELAICQDAELSRIDGQTGRKVQSLLSRLSYGQYLGLRYWQSRGAEHRDECGPDRACLTAHFREQNRFLDGLRRCLDGGAGRRTCWRTMQQGNVALPR